jgi:hypothetical protein
MENKKTQKRSGKKPKQKLVMNKKKSQIKFQSLF